MYSTRKSHCVCMYIYIVLLLAMQSGKYMRISINGKMIMMIMTLLQFFIAFIFKVDIS